MKALLVAAMAISTLTAAVSVAPATANAAVVVVKTGGHYYWGGRHWRHRTWVCKRRFHHKVCKYRYW